ncbi:hypothetical protein BHM03_00015299 [Ensete ventricosum]|nr:hypothetical protein BHM03_00015299 [Ensete ventricosum]
MGQNQLCPLSRHRGTNRTYWADTKIFHKYFGARRRANVTRTPVKQLECEALHGAEPSPPNGRGDHIGVDSEPFLEDDDRPEVLTAGSQPHAIRCHSRGLSRPYQPSSSVGRDSAYNCTLLTVTHTVDNPSIGSSDNTPPDGVSCGPESGRLARGRGATTQD